MSSTVTVNAASDVLPAASVAMQVTVVVPSGNIDPLGGVQVNDCTKPELSPASTSKSTTAFPIAEAETTMGAGTVVKTGGVSSITSISNWAIEELPAASVAVHVTSVTPIGSAEPDGGTQSTVTAPVALSLAVATYGTTALSAVDRAGTLKFAGRSSTGGVPSTTLTVLVAVVVRPNVSVTV